MIRDPKFLLGILVSQSILWCVEIRKKKTTSGGGKTELPFVGENGPPCRASSCSTQWWVRMSPLSLLHCLPRPGIRSISRAWVATASLEPSHTLWALPQHDRSSMLCRQPLDALTLLGCVPRKVCALFQRRCSSSRRSLWRLLLFSSWTPFGRQVFMLPCPKPPLEHLLTIPRHPKFPSHTLWGSVWQEPLKAFHLRRYLGVRSNTDPHVNGMTGRLRE